MLRTDHSSTSRQPAAPRFHSVSRSGIRRPHRRHPYAHHIRSLSGAIRRLIAELDLAEGGRVLDYGCADMPYRAFLPPAAQYVGADLAGNEDAAVIIEPNGTLPV